MSLSTRLFLGARRNFSPKGYHTVLFVKVNFKKINRTPQKNIARFVSGRKVLKLLLYSNCLVFTAVSNYSVTYFTKHYYIVTTKQSKLVHNVGLNKMTRNVRVIVTL